MRDFYAETRAIVESKASTLSKYTYDTYLSHLRKLQMYRPTAECRDITEAFVFGYVDFMHARKNSAGCIYRSLSILRMFIRELLRRRKIRSNYRFANLFVQISGVSRIVRGDFTD